MSLVEGGCLCGAVRYRAEAEPLAAMSCHCRDCQYISGGAEANVMVFPRAAFTRTRGEDRSYMSKAASGAQVWRSFCDKCGTPLFAGHESHPDVISIKVGSLDDPAVFARQAHIWVEAAPPWHHIEPDLPKERKNPDFLR